MFGALYYPLFLGFLFSAVGYSAKKIKNWELGPKITSLQFFLRSH
jgi:hypothetical protein